MWSSALDLCQLVMKHRTSFTIILENYWCIKSYNLSALHNQRSCDHQPRPCARVSRSPNTTSPSCSHLSHVTSDCDYINVIDLRDIRYKHFPMKPPLTVALFLNCLINPLSDFMIGTVGKAQGTTFATREPTHTRSQRRKEPWDLFHWHHVYTPDIL